MDSTSLPFFFSNHTWVQQVTNADVPAGTRFLRYRFEGARMQGNNNDAFLDAAFVTIGAPSVCDFDADSDCDFADLNAQLAEGPIAPGVPVTLGVNEQFDLTGDDLVDLDDLDDWLAVSGAANGFSLPLKRGDANLDGTVDGQDFVLWNAAKFTSTLRWDFGDFNGDGVNDGQDFILWNGKKFTSSDGVSAVPEPSAGMFLLALVLLGAAIRRR